MDLQQQRFVALSDNLIDLGLLDGDNLSVPASMLDYVPPTAVRIFLRDTATQAQKDQIKQIIDTWNWGDSPEDRIERQQIPQKALGCLMMRMSASWATMTTQEKNKAQGIIDDWGAKILTALRGV